MLTLVVGIVIVALVFDFINGFHDAANSIATVVSTRVLTPLQAVVWAAFFNFVAAFGFGVNVATTVGKGVVDARVVDEWVILAGLIGAIVWDIVTWYWGLPTSSSHALIGGFAGAAVAKAGLGSLVAAGLIKIGLFMILAPLIGLAVGFSLMLGTVWLFRLATPGRVDWLFRRMQLVSAAAYSLGHGTNDAQKTMGIIAVLLFSTGYLGPTFHVPFWVILAAHAAIALGTLSGGWRIVKTMGMRITKLRPVGGFCAETSGALVLLSTAVGGIPVSTTHTITGSIMGVGALQRFSAVRWGVAGRIVWAWVFTIPASALIAGVGWVILHVLHPLTGGRALAVSPLQILRSRIALKLTLTLVGFVGVTLVAAGVYLDRALQAFAKDSLQGRLTIAGRLLQAEARELLAGRAGAAAMQEFVVRVAGPTESRVTLIAADGRVLADSEVAPEQLAAVENHAGRPEVRAALAGHTGRGMRTSATVHEPLFYVGLPVRDGDRVIGVLRLALPLSVVTSSYAVLQRVTLLGGLLAIAVAAGIGIFVSRRITAPVVQMQRIARRMSEGDFAVRAPVRSVDEIGALGRALNVMAVGLRDKIQDLEDEHAKVAAILDGMVEGVVAVDGHDAVLLLNERARTILGVDPGRGPGKPLLEAIRNADLHEIVRATRTAEQGRASPHEFRVGASGESVIRVSAVPLALGGHDRGVVMVLHDVTELRRLEQVRTEFVANVSHELRTPLTAIQGYIETLLAGALDERENAQRFLEIAHRHTERLGRLLNDLTDLSNIELGKVSLRLAPTAVASVVESVLDIIRPRAEAAGVTLERALPDDLPAVRADHDRLAQILINLVDNAVKYSHRGGRVTVSATASDPATVEIAVVDAGVGIPAVDLPRITERFYRVDKARSRELGGTGLGLAIVKHLVIAHGGELRIESEVDRGTRVRFTLPAA